jgi:hypothetical protein
MKTKIITSMFLFFGITTAFAQVKIGNNPNTINANSLIELESTNKGLLAPRMALNSLTSASPLTAPVPEGMMVYSIGGTLIDGLYEWNGSQWMRTLNSADTRSNSVIVKSASDLPAPVSGIITLVSGTLYQINGTVALSSQINLNGCQVRGMDAVNDKLVYTGSLALFTGTTTGSIEFLTLNSTSGSIFNINGGGVNENLIMENCYLIGSSSLGTIQGVGGTTYFSNVAYFYNTNGITFQNDSIVLQYDLMWDGTNHNTYEKYIGKFSIVQILGGGCVTTLANSAVVIDISGVTSIGNGSVQSMLFTGTGTYTKGTFSDNWDVESIGISSQNDDQATGNCYIATPVATAFTAANTPTKILGTTTATNLFRVTSPTSNRLTYTGRKVQSFLVTCALSFTGGNNTNYSFYVSKNGVKLPESEMFTKMNSNGDEQACPITCTVSLNPGDYLEVWAENNTNTTSMTVETMNMTIK